MRRDFVKLLGESMEQLGYGNRSDFIRDAIVEKLRLGGVPVPLQYSAGVRRFKVEIDGPKAYVLNDSPPLPAPGGSISSDVARRVAASGDDVAAMVGRSATPAPSPKAASTTYSKRARPPRTAPRQNRPRSVPKPVPTSRENPT